MTLGGRHTARTFRAVAWAATLLFLSGLGIGASAQDETPTPPPAGQTAAPPPGALPPAAATAAASLPQGVIQHIAIDGTQRIEPVTVVSYMLVHEGDAYDEKLVDRSLKALFATGLFADVRINWDGATLSVHIVENPIINQVAFEGNSKLSESDLTKEVQVKPRMVFTRAKVQADVERIIELYRRAGHFAATVEPKIIQRPQNRVDLVFEINEGPATGISRINFIGNKVFDDSELKDQIVTTESIWWKFFATNDNYDPDRLTFDREQLRRFYLTHGYADFRVVSAVAELAPDRSGFFLTFTVDEGQQYRFGSLKVESQIRDLGSAELTPLIRGQEGNTYDGELIEKTIEALTYAAGTKGFAFVDIHPRVQRNKDARTIDVVYQIEQGPRVYVERINIVGNTRTLDRVIRREFRLAEGDAFNRVLVDRSRTRIRALGFFKDVDITEEPGSTPDRTVLTVKVQEQPTGELSLGVGYSSQTSFLIDFSYTERNLFGRGQFLRTSIAWSSLQRQFNLSFTEPYFLGQPLAAGFQIFKTITQFIQASYASDATGGSLLLGFPVSEYGRITPHYSYVTASITAAAGAPLAVQLAKGTASTSALGFTYSYDDRDDPFRPTSGGVFTFSQDIAGFGGDQKYVRTEVHASWFHNIIFDDLVGSAVLNTGWITGYHGQNVRLNDRFFKGGDSFRGFEIAGVGPRDVGHHLDAALGGQFFAIGSFELRLPSFLPADYGFDFSLFTDLGTVGIVSGTHLPCTPTSCIRDDLGFRGSTGLSVSWKSPFGPVRMSFAYPFAKDPYDKTQTIYFSAASNF